MLCGSLDVDQQIHTYTVCVCIYVYLFAKKTIFTKQNKFG